MILMNGSAAAQFKLNENIYFAIWCTTQSYLHCRTRLESTITSFPLLILHHCCTTAWLVRSSSSPSHQAKQCSYTSTIVIRWSRAQRHSSKVRTAPLRCWVSKKLPLFLYPVSCFIRALSVLSDLSMLGIFCCLPFDIKCDMIFFNKLGHRYIWSNMLDLQRWAQGKEKCSASRSFAGGGSITRHFSASNFGAKVAQSR